LCIITAFQHISPEAIRKGFLRSVVYPMQWLRLMMICCGMAVKRFEMLGVNVRKIKALSVMIKTVILIGKGR
jgi:hypothetical protein